MVESALNAGHQAAMMPTSLYDHPNVYDLVMLPGPCEAFYRQLAQRTGGPILELACGSGRLTLPLARDGYRITGLDASRAMLNSAREKARAEGLQIAFVEADMRSFDIGELFALVIISCNSLAHLVTHADIRTCLTRARRHLAPGGLLAFDVVNPKIDVLNRSSFESVRLDNGPNPSSGIAIEEFGAYDPIEQIRVLRWRMRDPVASTGDLAPLTLRQFFPQEVPLLLEAAGFKLLARYGDFSGNPLCASSMNQIFVATARTE